MKKNAKKKKVIASALAISFLTPNIGGISADAATTEDLQIAITRNPLIDVVLTLGNTNVNATNFANDLKARLQQKGIDTSKVNIESVVAREETVFLGRFAMNIWWANNGSDMDSHTEFWSNGTKVDEMFYGKLNVFGSTLDTDDTSGGRGEWSTINFDTIPAHVNELRFYVNPYRGSATTSLRLVRTLNGVQETLIDSPQFVSGSKVYFGKLVRNGDAWDFVYNNGQVYSGKQVVIQSKRFSEVIRQPSWREGSERFLVNLENQPVSDFDNPQASGEISSRLINEEISYVAMGTSANQAQANSFIARNNGNGTFINNTNYSYALDQLATYIDNKIKAEQAESGNSQYVLIGEPLNIDVIPAHLRTNTQTAEYPQGRWRVDHDYNYFHNSLGQAANSGQYQPNLQVAFDKPGRYELWFGDKHPNPQYVYAHRRPVANFSLNVQANGSNFLVSANNQSFDPDYQYNADKGIAEVEWKWRETTAQTWNNGMIPSTLPLGKDYIVQLRVKDHQGVWSLPEARYITTSSMVAKPVANFDIPTVASRYETVAVNDTSYDPAGRAITQKQWVVKKNGTQVYSGATPVTNFNSYGEGTYEVSLKVLNNAGLWSEEFKRTITITADTTKPEVNVNPTRQDWTMHNINVTATFSDAGGSGFNSQRYAVTNSPNFPTSGWSAWSSATTQNIPITAEGRWYVHLEAKDNAGNVLQRTMGEYQIDKAAPNAPTFALSNSNPTNQNISLTINYPADAVKKQYQLGDGGAWADYTGALTITDNVKVNARAIDQANNVSQVSSINITNIDRVAPGLATFTANTTPTSQDVPVTINYPADATVKEYKIGASGTWTVYTSSVVMTDNGTIFARSRDAAGNQSAESSFVVNNIDKVAPVQATFSAPTAPTNGNVPVTINYPSDASVKEYKIGASGTWTPYTGAVSMTDNGTIFARSKDAVGNVSPESSYVVSNIDRQAPGLATLTPDKTTATNTNVTVTATFPADATVREVKVGNGQWMPYTAPVVITQNTTVHARSKDAAGNVSPEVSYQVRNIDTVAPETPTFVADKTQPTNTDVRVTVSFPDDATVKQVKVGNGQWTAYTAPVVITDNNTTVLARAYDEVGNVSAEGSYRVTNIDKVRPSAPTIEQEVDTISLISGTDDRNGIRDTQIRINGGEWTSYTAPIKLADGEYTIEAKSIDGVGNESTSSLHTFVYDDTLKQAEFLTVTVERFPAQSKIDEAKAVVNQLPNVAPEKQELLNRLQQAEAKINNTKVTNDLNDIERIVDRGSASNEDLARLQEQLENLKDIVATMPDGSEKQALLDKIKQIEEKIEALKKANELSQNLGTLTDAGSLVELINLIGTLPDGSLKDQLQNQLEDAQNLIEAKDKVNELVANPNPTWEDLQQAKDAVNKLPNGPEKDALLEKIKEIEEQLKAKDAVKKAEETLSKGDYDKALEAISKVDDADAKQELLDRLQEISDEANVVGLVEVAQQTRNQDKIDEARTAVNELPDGELKDDLLFELEKIDTKLANATSKVRTAEAAKTDSNVARAEEAIEKLVDSPQKQALIDRLNEVKEAIAEKKNADAVENATKKVEQAEQFKRDPYLSNAFELVNALPNSPAKSALLDRLNTIVANNEAEKQSEEQNVERAKQLADATKKVERVESLKREPYISTALDAVNALPNSPEKQALLDRIQAVKDALDAEALAKLVTDVTKKVEVAERYKRDPYITDAVTAVNSLPNGAVKDELKARLDALIVVENPGEGQSTEDGEFNPGDNVVEVSETIQDPIAKNVYLGWAKAVERAEKYFSRNNIKFALEKLEEVPVEVRNNPRYSALYTELKNRTDALKEVYNQMVADKNLEREIQKATTAVESYERYKTELFKTKAQDLVNGLAEGTVKTMLQARIDAVQNS